MEALTDHDASDVNRKRKMSPGPMAGGLKRGNKLTRPNPLGPNGVNGSAATSFAAANSVVNGVTPPGYAAGTAVTPQGSINTSDKFIDHQKALMSADVAPTPHCPVSNIPPTPAFVNRNGFGHTPDSFAGTPSEDFSSAVGGLTPQEQAALAQAGSDTPQSAKAHAPTPSPVPRAAPLNLRNFANWNVTSRYTLVRLLGKGSYGQVWCFVGRCGGGRCVQVLIVLLLTCVQVAEAIDNETQKKVAIKKIINVFDQEIDCKRLFREIYILRRLK